MAKKTVKKVKPPKRSGTESIAPEKMDIELLTRLTKLERRIDSIVDAHEHCKSLRNL